MKKLRGAAALLVLLWGLMLPVCALGDAAGPVPEPPAPMEITLLFNQVFLADNILVTEGDALSLETELEDRSQLRGENLLSDIMRLNPSTLQSSLLPSTGGNRDGGDAEEPGTGPPLVQTPPPAPGHESPGSQPPPDGPLVLPVGKAEPTPSPQPNPTPSPAQGLERVEGDTLTISGARLLWLLEQNPETVPFGWNGISLQLPAAFLKGLGLGDSDLLTLSLTQEEDLEFTISLTAKGEKITELEEALVRLPAPEPLEGYTLTLDGETLGTTVTYERGCAVFPITQTGRYALSENKAPEDAPPPAAPAPEDGAKEPWVQSALKSCLPAALLLGLACAAWLWWRKCRL